MTDIEWPSREEWARQRRTCYYDLSPNVSRSLSDYATSAEIEALIVAMRERWKALGRQVRRLEGGIELRWKRACINRGLKLIRNGEIPICFEDYAGAEDIVADLHTRHRTAKVAAYERWERATARAPIDDSAWEQELAHRARVERYFKVIRHRERIA
jgi:hypothetical protein